MVIDLVGGVGIKMKYPGLEMLNRFKDVDESNVTAVFELIIDCIDSVYDDDNFYPASEQTREELESFINNLTQEQFQKIQNFFQTMPKLEKKVEFNCPVCGYKHNETIQGLNGFF